MINGKMDEGERGSRGRVRDEDRGGGESETAGRDGQMWRRQMCSLWFVLSTHTLLLYLTFLATLMQIPETPAR